MSNTHLIEVAVFPDVNNTERGRVLERFARRFLETQNYRVQEEVRLTASEVDLLGTENTTGERIFVECKAYRSTISAEVLQKLLGNITLKGYAAGWLISTFELGKDAKGFEDEWNQKTPDERRKLHIYPPDRLIERLVNAKLVVDVATLRFDHTRFKVDKSEASLLLTQNGEFWALPVLNPDTRIRSAALLFEAETGKPVTESATLEWIAKTNTTLSLPWLSDTTGSQTTAASKLASFASYGRILQIGAEDPILSSVRKNLFLRRPQWELVCRGAYALRPRVLEKLVDRFNHFMAKRKSAIDELKVPIFWIRGRSGDGKSVLLLQLIKEALSRPDPPTIFLCKSPDDVINCKRCGYSTPQFFGLAAILFT